MPFVTTYTDATFAMFGPMTWATISGNGLSSGRRQAEPEPMTYWKQNSMQFELHSISKYLSICDSGVIDSGYIGAHYKIMFEKNHGSYSI